MTPPHASTQPQQHVGPPHANNLQESEHAHLNSAINFLNLGHHHLPPAPPNSPASRLVQGKGSIIWEKCGFAEGWELPREGLSGGLLLTWLPQLQLHICYEFKHLVHTNLVDNQGNPLSITFVYGNLELSKREEVWNKLRSLKLLAYPTIKLVLSYLRVAQVFSYQTN